MPRRPRRLRRPSKSPPSTRWPRSSSVAYATTSASADVRPAGACRARMAVIAPRPAPGSPRSRRRPPDAPAAPRPSSRSAGRAPLVEGPLEPLFALALVLLHGLARRANLIEQDARHRRERGAVEPPLGVPELGTPEGLRAVEEALLDLDADGDQGTLAVGGQPLEDLVVANDPRAPV